MITEIKSVIDNVERLLTDYPQIRDSDMKVIWTYWIKIDKVVVNNTLNLEGFMKATAPESITRACRKCREMNSALSGSTTVEEARKVIESVLRVELKKTNQYDYRGLLKGEGL